MRLFDMDSKKDYLLDGKYKVATPYAPCVNVAEIIRCKDCKHGQYDATHYFCAEHGHKVYEDDFCSYGERKSNMSITTTPITYKRYCKGYNVWCEYANEYGYCSCTACYKHYDMKKYSTSTDYTHTCGGTYKEEE